MRLFRLKKKKKKKTLRGYDISLCLGLWFGKGILPLKHYFQDTAKKKLQVKKKQAWAEYQEIFSDRIVMEEIN